MQTAARWFLLLFVFTIPWEYSLDLGPPFGNISRLAGLVLLPLAVLAVLQSGSARRPGPAHWLTLALYLWFCCTYFWSAAPEATAIKLRGYAQEMMLVWLVWEFVRTPRELRNLMRAWLAGSWVLGILSLANFALYDPTTGEQIRFAAAGQDPNDVARFISLGMPVAALLLDGQERWWGRLLAAGYIPLGLACVLLTGSRSGLVVALVALAGCALILWQRSPKIVAGAAIILPVLACVAWLAVPHETLARFATISEQLRNADLNQRVSIWLAGWRAFLAAPLFGHGGGSFVVAAGLASDDTAHNTVLAILVEGGLCALGLATAIVVFAVRAALATSGMLRIGLITLMETWFVSSLAGTVGESRITWLLLGMTLLAGHLANQDAEAMDRAFPISFRLESALHVTEPR
jgi:O-antigen ligase